MKESKNNTSLDKKPQRRFTKVNNIVSIDSISERNEESSTSTAKNQKLQSKNALKKRMISSEISKLENNLNI